MKLRLKGGLACSTHVDLKPSPSGPSLVGRISPRSKEASGAGGNVEALHDPPLLDMESAWQSLIILYPPTFYLHYHILGPLFPAHLPFSLSIREDITSPMPRSTVGFHCCRNGHRVERHLAVESI